MIKIGDKVAPFDRMGETGQVINLVAVKTKTWMVGGASGKTFRAVVKLDKDGENKEYWVAELMRLE
mgnify:CR=1 FL=1|jgi:hypothetical protein